MEDSTTLNPIAMDPETWVIYLHVPSSDVVILQGFMELYEGVGTVRTLDIRLSLVCILTTTSMLQDCIEVLHSLSSEVDWRPAERPTKELEERYLGYFARAREERADVKSNS